MRHLLWVYLACYLALVCGAAITLWRSGLIDYLHRGWTVAAIAIALVLGLALAAVSRTWKR